MVKKIEIVSLSKGIIGEPFIQFETSIGINRLKEMGLEVVFSENALKGLDFIEKHPELRAKDLINALKDPTVDMILCAIGGDDTYRLLPYLFENNELQKVANQKIFLGFSDSTMNHFMLNKVGINTFYGQSFLADVCELDKEMLPYSYKYFNELIHNDSIKKIKPSNVWYHERTSYKPEDVGTARMAEVNNGFELLQGSPIFSGKIFGGCIDTIFDMFDNTRYSDSVELCKKYKLFPETNFWKGRILLLETSEETMSPAKFKRALEYLKEEKVFCSVNGILFGKPVEEIYSEEYKKLLISVVGDKSIPIVANVNIGHNTPRCIIPFGVDATVNVNKMEISLTNK